MVALKRCKHGRRMVPIVNDLWLSECCSYGDLTRTVDGIEAVRQLLEKNGTSVEQIRQTIEQEERDTKLARMRARDAKMQTERAATVER